MRRSGFLGMLLLSMGLGAVALVSGPAQGSQASGGGTYFVEPGVRSEFQFSPSHVQCKIGQTVLADGTVLQIQARARLADGVPTSVPEALTASFPG